MRFNNKNYDLPKKTLALNKKIENVNHSKSTSEAYENMMEFVLEGLGEEKVIELLGTSDINEVDLIQLNLLCNQITMAYDETVMNEQISYMENVMKKKGMQSVMELIKKAGEMAK